MAEVHVPLETVAVEGKSYQVTPKTAAMIRKAIQLLEDAENRKQVTVTIEGGVQ